MAFVDDLTISARAGRGGDGVVRWLHLKGKEFSGPAGGNGGDGGDVYIRAVRDIGLLSRYRGAKAFQAGSGNPGENQSKAGARGKDLVIELPVGSLVSNQKTGERYDLAEEGAEILVLKGGRGGAGNAVFRSSVNQRPVESLPGAAGEEASLHIELRLIADAGLVGLPNAGKTSLLNALTGASAKAASYAFTTLDPNLGMLHGYVLADIPGLIEGASSGKGLGFKFLRHIARTRLIVHCISLESKDPWVEYEIVRKELGQFENGTLTDKREVVVFTKSDMRTPSEVDELLAHVQGKGVEAYAVTVLDDASVQALGTALAGALKDNEQALR